MIDSHCHLEQEDYDKDRDKVIEECRKKIKAIMTCCASPKDWSKTKDIVTKYKGFVYAIAGIHPEFIKDISENEIKKFIEIIRYEAKKGFISAIGEVGLDYWWIKEEEFRKKQEELFIRMINMAKELNLPLVVHSRKAVKECIGILEKEGMKNKKVLMHLMTENKFTKKIVENKWMISIGPNILKNKNLKKVARDCPLKNMLLETDSPWFGIEEKRGTPLNVFKTAEKVAEIKKLPFEEIEKQTDENAIDFFELDL
ncbi:MAG: TatD family hydrolase [Candidatus Pacearchaeota archaeon]